MPPPPDPQALRHAILARYAQVARSAEGQFGYATGHAGARALGYDAADLAAAPAAALASFCGVGNPLGLGPIPVSGAVLDVGCGAGFDLGIAARRVGAGGRAVGVDPSPAMAARARAHLPRSAAGRADVVVAWAEALPFADASFDVVLSNGVLNLAVDKPAAFRELHRVLRPGGWLRFADIVLDDELPVATAGSLEAWSN